MNKPRRKRPDGGSESDSEEEAEQKRKFGSLTVALGKVVRSANLTMIDLAGN